MPRRIDIELTSARDDGSWTWRAAGALKPRGVLDGKLLYPGASVGDVIRAEADFDIEGITVLTVLPPKAKRPEPERLELISPAREHVGGVTSSLVSKQDRRERDRDRERRPDRDRDRTRERAPRREQPAEGADRRPGRPRGRPDESAAQTAGAAPPRRSRAGADRPERRPERRPPERPAPPPPKPKPKRLNPANVHRNAVLESLPHEQRPWAEQVLRGGIPAVRQAIEADNAKARAEGRAETSAEALLMLAEALLPRLKAAEWRDRAEAAVKAVDEIGLRDLRAVVASADAVARDDESRSLASQLREALERRTTAEFDEWNAEVSGALAEGRVVRALRLSAHPPDPASRLPGELAVRLAEAASAAMSPDALPDRWSALLEAVSASPVRRTVKPAGLPAEPGPALLQAARQASGKVPALAAMLGIEMPPPPGPARAGPGRRPPRPGRPPATTPPRGSPPAAPEKEVSAATGEPPVAEEGWLPTDPPVAVPDSPAEAVARLTLSESEEESSRAD